MPECYDNLGRQYWSDLPCSGPDLGGTLAGVASQFNPTQGGSAGQAAVRELPGATGNTGANPGDQFGQAFASSNPGAAIQNQILPSNLVQALSDPTNYKRAGLVLGAVFIVVLGTALLLFGPAKKAATSGLPA
jgi:hypothetical protein